MTPPRTVNLTRETLSAFIARLDAATARIRRGHYKVGAQEVDQVSTDLDNLPDTPLDATPALAEAPPHTYEAGLDVDGIALSADAALSEPYPTDFHDGPLRTITLTIEGVPEAVADAVLREISAEYAAAHPGPAPEEAAE